jgi:CheY-like chemotaxis protein
MESSARPREILLVDDNLADAHLVEQCLRRLPFPYHLRSVSDGEEVLAFLQHHIPYTTAPTPDLIILDIHLIRKSGWEVLAWLKATPAVAAIPVIMLTGVLSPRDQQECDRLQPLRCLMKPERSEEYHVLATAIEEVIRQPPSSV